MRDHAAKLGIDSLRHTLVKPKESSQMKTEKPRGFAAMDPQRQRAIAKMGGSSVPNESRSFSKDRKLAAEAGRKGGLAVPAEKRSFSQDHELAVECGRKGGMAVPDEKRSFSQNHELAVRAGTLGGSARVKGDSTARPK